MSRRVLIVLGILGVLAITLGLGVWRLVRLSQVRPDHLGWRGDGFFPCPDMPNCVSSLATDPRHAVEPLLYAGDREQAMDRLAEIVDELPNSAIVTSEEGYLHAEIRSPGLGYVDDIELYIQPESGLIHVKSAARVPYYDFGVNHERVEALRQAWEERR